MVAKTQGKKSKTIQQRSRRATEDKSEKKSRAKKDVKKPTKEQKDKVKRTKEKITEKKKEDIVVSPKQEENTIPEVKGEKPAKLKEKLPAKKVKEIPIEKIKFHGRKSLSNEERKKIGFIISKKKKKPKFAREEMYKVKKLKDVWRRRRGIDSKAAEEKRGKGKLPGIGYKKPNLLTGIDPSGYYSVLVHNSNELRALNPGRDAIIIASAVGRRKRNEIIRVANDLKVTILNPRKGEI